MSTRYRNSPLVEAVAELRWPVMPFIGQQQGSFMQLPASDPQQLEPAFNALAVRMGSLGFNQVERMVPLGMPFLPAQPAFRFKKSADAAAGNFIYQAGQSFFATNALQPYITWTDFLSAFQVGLASYDQFETLVISKSECTPTLRYVNGFRSDLTSGHTPSSFISNVLGLHLNIPEPILNSVPDQQSIGTALQLKIPYESGSLVINLGDGKIENDRAVVLELVFICNPVAPYTAEAVCEALRQAHDVIERIFLQLTNSIHELMQPEEV